MEPRAGYAGNTSGADVRTHGVRAETGRVQTAARAGQFPAGAVPVGAGQSHAGQGDDTPDNVAASHRPVPARRLR